MPITAKHSQSTITAIKLLILRSFQRKGLCNCGLKAKSTTFVNNIKTEYNGRKTGLSGFSSGNLKKMRIFYEEWKCLSIGSPLANQLQQLENKIEEGVEIGEKTEILIRYATLYNPSLRHH